ncbi:MAG TPA: AsmA family protein [Acidobacteriota bacterium]|nr:AsmA family protein [Acidobacteriota bacterium]
MTRLRKIALWVAGALVLLVILGAVIAKVVFTKERILAALTPRIEERINRPVQIREAGIAVFGGIGVWLGDITVGNRPGFSDEPLLTLHRFDLKARFWPLLAGRVELDHVLLVAPSVLLEYDADGNSNLDDLIRSPAETDSLPGAPGEQPPSSGPPLTVDRIRIQDGSFMRRDARSQSYLSLSGIDLDFRWNDPGHADRRAFTAELALDSLELTDPDGSWSVGRDRPAIFCMGAWDGSAQAVHCDSLTLTWWGATLSAQGIVRRYPAVTEIQLQARLHPMALQDVVARVAKTYPALPITDLEGTAAGELTTGLVWPLPEGVVPDWHLDLVFTDVGWRLPGREETLILPRLEIRGEEQALSWSGPAGRLGDGSLSVSGTIDRLFDEEPMLSARVRARVPAASLKQIVAPDEPLTLTGDCACDLTAFGRLSAWRDARIAGDVSAERIVVGDTAWAFDSVAAGFSLHSDGEQIEIRSCDWQAGESAGRLTGRIDGLISRVRSGAQSPDVPRAQLDLRCSRLNLDQLIGEPAAPGDSAASDTASAMVRALLAAGTIRADTVIYSGVRFTQVRSEYEYKNSRLTLEPASGRVFGGPVAGSLAWDLNDRRHPVFATRVRADSMRADGFLTRYLNWAGGVVGLVSFDAQLGGRGRVAAEIVPTLVASGRADMRSGRLEAAPLLASVGTALGITGLDRPHDLRDVAIPFRIADGRVHTDRLRFTSGDFHFEAEGSFGLDRTLAYNVTVTASEGRSGASLLGATELPFQLSGTVTDPKVHLDKAAAARSLVEDLAPKVVDSATKVLEKAIDNLLKPRKP